LGLPISLAHLELVLPVGISFYTFQSLSYTIDVYRRRMERTRSPLDFALFVAFFPQLVAGPIVRAASFLPQLGNARRFAEVNLRFHLTLFLVGYVKKACVADQLARAIDPVFAAPELYGAASQWLASCLYTLQIYCDFSGYTDMAVACAGLLGYRLAENFNFPYLARSFREYWRRWHISLSSWFRDYLYIPLGGSRRSPARVGLNLLLVFFLCGLWHGAAWTFVLWGLYHGAFIGAERWIPVSRMPRWLGHVYLLLFTNLGFVIFRAADLPTAIAYLRGLFSPDLVAVSAGIDPWWWLLLVGFALVHCWGYRKPVEQRVAGLPAPVFALGYGAAVALTLPWAASGYQPFIYFQF
jgi:alginate O-acetyltransferase complex protein AlgI